LLREDLKMRNYLDENFYVYVESDLYKCGACLKADLKKTKEGEYVGDERVYPGMFRRLPAGEAYMCDDCGYCNDEYENLGGDDNDAC
jgi:hypothetical protein